jgi:hypothetical protein
MGKRNASFLMLDALKILIDVDQDFAIGALPFFEMLLRHGIAFCARVKSVDGLYQDLDSCSTR